jgi:hypothetical protein
LLVFEAILTYVKAMRKAFTPQERDAFAVAVSAVEGLTRTSEQTALFRKFESDKSSLADQIAVLMTKYALAK